MLNELQKKTVTVVTAQLLYMEQRREKPKTQNKQHDTSLIPNHKWSHSLQSGVEVN